VRAKFQQLQLSLLERSLEPADFPFDPKTAEDIRALQVGLLHRSLQRTITGSDFALGNQAVRNLIQIICPKPAPIVNVTQQVTQQQVNAAELKRILPNLPEDEQIVLAKYIKRLETMP
jgi:hypothetical protein